MDWLGLDWCILCLQLLTLVLVPLAPVHPLALDRAVEDLLALRAPLVLQGLSFGGRAVRANVEQGFTLVFLLLVDGVLETLLLFEPLHWCVVHPRVEDGEGAANDLLRWALLRPESIQHVVLVLNAKHVEARLEILRDEIDSIPRHLLLLLVPLLCLVELVVFERPDSRVT